MVTIQPVRSGRELKRFVLFPWQIYRGDRCWVPPILSDRLHRLDLTHNAYWQSARRELWLAYRQGRPVGTIAAIIEDARIEKTGQKIGAFGFFECVNDQEVANALLRTAEQWLRQNGMTCMIGPYHPSNQDEPGLLVEGFDTRPAIMEGHNPPYYQLLFERYGMVRYDDLLARLYTRPVGARFEQELPARLVQAAERARKRKDLVIRSIDLQRWDEEIELARTIFNTALKDLPDSIPISQEAFARMAASFRPMLDPRLGLLAEVDGKPAGFALVLPDVNEALQKVNGRLGPIGMLKLLWYSRRLTRVSFKILMVLQEYQGRGIEAVLMYELAKAIWDMGFREVDMSLTGESNDKSHRLQEKLGFKIYRRYRIYQKELSA